MLRLFRWAAICVITGSFVCIPTGYGDPPPKEKPAEEVDPAPSMKEAVQLRDRLYKTVKFAGLDDPTMTFRESLNLLNNRYNVLCLINYEAFAAKKMPDVETMPIATRPIPAFPSVTLETVLRQILARIANDATYTIRRDFIEITTTAALQAEFYPNRNEAPFPRLVYLDLHNRTIVSALREIQNQVGLQTVCNAQISEESLPRLTTMLWAVPADTAVKVLSESVGLTVFTREELLFITQAANPILGQIERRQDRRNCNGFAQIQNQRSRSNLVQESTVSSSR